MENQEKIFSRFRFMARACAGIVAAVGTVVLLGWGFDVQVLKSVLPDSVSMKANTAFCFLFAGIALWFLVDDQISRKTRFMGRACAAVIALVGFFTFTQYLFGWNLGLDQILFKETLGAVGTSSPGRMAPATALNFFLLGVALLLLYGGWRPLIVQGLVLLSGLVSIVAVAGHLYETRGLYSIGPFTSMAFHTALSFTVLSVGILLAHPQQGLMAIIASDTAGGLTARRLLPVGVVIPLAMGWLRLFGERAGYYDTGMGVALFAISTAVVLTYLIWRHARMLFGIEVERKLAEEERDKFFTLSVDMLCIAGFDGYFKRLNPAWENTLGYTIEELKAKPNIEFIHPDDREATIAARKKIRAGENVISFENRFQCKNGSYKWLLWNATPSLDNQLTYAAARDITDRKRAEKETGEARAFLDSVVENIPNMIFVKEAKDLRFIRFNRAGEDLLGFSRKELIGKNDYDFFPKEQAEFFTAKDREVLEKGELLDIPEEPIKTTNKGVRFLHTKKIPILDQTGQPQYLLGISEDITERREAEERIKRLNEALKEHAQQLAAANKELEAFSYSVSHDLRAPLRHMDGFAELLQKNLQDTLNEKNRHYLNTILESAKRMGRLIDDLLVFSRMGRAEMLNSSVNLDQLVQEVIRELKPETEGRDIVWQVSPLPKVAGDPSMLRQVLMNLISNALKYTRTRPQVRVEIGHYLEPTGESVVYVRDNGVGFDMQYKEKLFGVFQRLHRSEEFEGTGIGLANVRRIIQRHGGKTWAEGKVDEGATFYFSLPNRTEEKSERTKAHLVG